MISKMVVFRDEMGDGRLCLDGRCYCNHLRLGGFRSSHNGGSQRVIYQEVLVFLSATLQHNLGFILYELLPRDFRSR